MFRKIVKEVPETLTRVTGVLRLAGQAVQKDSDINRSAEEYAKEINERLLKLSETIIGNIELLDGDSLYNSVNEINSLGKGYGIINTNDLLAEYQVIGTFVRANSFYSLSAKLQVDSTNHWLTEQGEILNKEIKEGSEKYKQKCSRIIEPFLSRFNEKEKIDVIFETKHPYKRKVKATMHKTDFEEGWMKGKVKLYFYDGGEAEKSDHVVLSKISVLR